ncbi:MAG: RnfABCDGE type electron transport complex subunit B [Planctomycetota bacterium]|jgi:RnfABCDGE-type electron transport complex B subunit
MIILLIVIAAATMLALAILMGYVLGWANKAFHVEVDPRIEHVEEALPGANCGGCGYIGCRDYAEAVVAAGEAVDLCPVGGESCAAEIAQILGVEIEQSWPYRPAVHCGASYDERLQLTAYRGEQQCASANIVGGVQGCTYGCLGFRDCDRSCNFDAIHTINGLATVDYDKCVGCGACAKVCPRNIITMVPFKVEQMVVVRCANKDFGKDVKAVCKVGCLGCKACARASELFKFEDDNIPVIDYDAYDPEKMEEVEVALSKCPMKRLEKVGKPKPEDLAAVGDEQVPQIVQADFKTTVDDTEWHG